MAFTKTFSIITLIILLFLFYAINVVGIVFSTQTLHSKLSILGLVVFFLNILLPCLSLVLYKWKRYIIVIPQIVLLVVTAFTCKDSFEAYYLLILSIVILIFQVLALVLAQLSTKTTAFLEEDQVNFAQANY